MKKQLSVMSVLVMACAVVMLGVQSVVGQAPYKVVWSHYTGWEPWAYAESSGILAEQAKKFGVSIKLELINDYGESINRYTSDKSVVAVTITEMDALVGPCVGGVDSTVLIMGDYSNGNDAIVLKNGTKVADLAGREVMLVENSVSHYVLYRALGMANMPITKVKTKNVSDSDIAALFTAATGNAATVTWNPPLMTVRQTKGATKVFDSSQIPGEVMDVLLVRTDAPEGVKRALTATWYAVMKIMNGQGDKSSQALASMAKSAGGTDSEFGAQLKTTYMFYDPAKAVEFMKDPKLKTTLDYVRGFCYDRGLYNGAGSKDYVGIQFPDGSVLGSTRNVKLRFEPKYMVEAAAGKL
ncbi:MAG: hypothetical protein RLZZ347_361 [Candidatus Parcubacteria bacterium]|jgi:NitT/TauT family transport system substrate-binding protein